MSDCIFCDIPALVCKKMPVLCIGIPVPKNTTYLSYKHINNSQSITKSNFNNLSFFTPGSRLDMNLNDANQLVAHRAAWIETIDMKEPYYAFFDNSIDLENNDISFRLENIKLPKDWDVLKITDTQYILTKRATKIFLNSNLQFHLTLKILIDSFEILKVLDLDGKIIKAVN